MQLDSCLDAPKELRQGLHFPAYRRGLRRLTSNGQAKQGLAAAAACSLKGCCYPHVFRKGIRAPDGTKRKKKKKLGLTGGGGCGWFTKKMGIAMSRLLRLYGT